MKLVTFTLLTSLLLCLSLGSCKKDCFEDIPACTMPAEPGLCQAAIQKYYFNQTTKKCEVFTWGGCGTYPFDTQAECEVCLCNKE